VEDFAAAATALVPEPVVSVARRIISARADEVTHYAKLYPLLLGNIPEIMEDWDRSTDELPWSGLEASGRQNNLVSVLTRVVDCAMGSASREERVNALLQIACGQQRGGICGISSRRRLPTMPSS